MINYLEKFSIKDKTAYVVGGLGLIGVEISKALSSAGAKTVILDIDEAKGRTVEKEINKHGYTSYYEHFDATMLEKIDSRIDRLVKKYGSVDIWVNSSFPKTKDWGDSIEDLRLDSWRKNVDMHLNSYAWISRQVALVMRKLKLKGTIINLGSIYGIQGNDFSVYKGTNMTGPMAYSAIKGGIVNLTRYLAAYFGPYGIRVNNVCPGGIFDNQDKKFVANYEQKVPLARMGKPEEIASVVLFLASDSASYINGTNIIADGGFTII